MALRLPTHHVPPRQRTSYSTADKSILEKNSHTSQRQQQLDDDATEWILFSSSQVASTSHPYCLFHQHWLRACFVGEGVMGRKRQHEPPSLLSPHTLNAPSLRVCSCVRACAHVVAPRS